MKHKRILGALALILTLCAITSAIAINSDDTDSNQDLVLGDPIDFGEIVFYFDTNGGTLEVGSGFGEVELGYYEDNYRLYTTFTGYVLPTPTKDGYIFAGWYFDESFTDPFQTSDAVDGSHMPVLYAKWIKAPTDGTVLSDDGKTLITAPSNAVDYIIPETVETVAGYAFFKCKDLKSITFPESVKTLEPHTFDGLGLISVYIPLDATYMDSVPPFFNIYRTQPANDPLTYTYDESALTASVSGCDLNAENVSIPHVIIYEGNKYNITSIGDGAFSFYDLTSITIPDSVTSIGKEAFNCCSSLTSITIPDSVTSIGEGAFYDCAGLTSITIPDSVTSIEYNTFYNCSKLTSLTIPNCVTSIGNTAFHNCSSLTSITIPDSVTSIGEGAFYDCAGLTSITFEHKDTLPVINTHSIHTRTETNVYLHPNIYKIESVNSFSSFSSSYVSPTALNFFQIGGVDGLFTVFVNDGSGWSYKAVPATDAAKAVQKLSFWKNDPGAMDAMFNTDGFPNSSYGTITEFMSKTNDDTNVWNVFVYINGSWEIGDRVIGKYRCFDDWDSEYQTANIALMYGPEASSVPEALKTYSADKRSSICAVDEDFVAYFYIKASTTDTPNIHGVVYDFYGNTITPQSLEKGIILEGYGSDAYLALKDALNVTSADNVTGCETFSTAPYGTVKSIFGLSDERFASSHQTWQMFQSNVYLGYDGVCSNNEGRLYQLIYSEVGADDGTIYSAWSAYDAGDDGYNSIVMADFKSSGGSSIPPQFLESGEKITKPEDPAREGYTFGGWYSDSELINAYDFNAGIPSSGITLYAKWILGTAYTVTFESNGGSAVTPQMIGSGSIPGKPEDPAREGYTFGGWYSDPALTEEYTFTTAVTENITLYAKWYENLVFTSVPSISDIKVTVDGRTITASVAADNYLYILWDMGNGETVKTYSNKLAYTYADNGDYTIKVTAVNSEGSSKTVEYNLNIEDKKEQKEQSLLTAVILFLIIAIVAFLLVSRFCGMSVISAFCSIIIAAVIVCALWILGVL